jgi:hypothetical protein
LLIEEGRTNLVTYSGAVGGTNWSTSAATPTLNSIMAPDGTTTATLVTENTALSNHSIFGTNAVLAVATHTASAFIKAGTRRYVSIRAENSGTGYAWITFDTTTGAINANASVTSSSATAFGNGWWRVTLTWANTVTTASNMVFAGSDVSTAPPTNNVLGNIYTGTSSTFYVWGAQFEAGSFATSYIPTTTGSVVRSADVCSITGGDFNNFYNQSEGTLLLSADEFRRGVSYPALLQISNSAIPSNNRVSIVGYPKSGDAVPLEFAVTSGGTFQYSAIQTSTPSKFKAAIAYKLDDARAALNGALAAADAPPSVSPIGANNLIIGGLGIYISSVRYYKKRLPDAKLVTLTT